MSIPKTIITYLVDGNPQSIKTVELSNRLIKGIFIPRKSFKNALERKELNYPGIYFLFGNDEKEDNLAYIGQATNLGKRISDHYKNNEDKGFWNYVVLFTYKDGSLNETDINYLEKILINKSKQTNRYKVKNSTVGNTGNISEYRISDMNEFIEDMEILLSSLGYPILTEIVSNKEKENKDNLYYITARGSDGKGIYTQEGFLVLKGSYGPKEMAKSTVEGKLQAFKYRPILLEKGVLKEEGDRVVFLTDYLFKTPSAASDVVMGRSSNGWTTRKDGRGKTLDENERNINEIDEMGFKLGEKYESLQDLPDFKIGKKYLYKQKLPASAIFLGENGIEQEFFDKDMPIYRKREE